MNIRFFATTTLVLLISACGQDETAQPASAAAEAASETEMAATAATLSRSPSSDGATVFFITPATGDTVSNPVSIEFGIAGMTVVRAGDEQPNSGHHHLLIDTGLPDLGLPIPADEHHLHFGDGSTSTEITLAPGEHTLQMLLGDYRHIAHDRPVVSDPITITVE